MESFIIKKEEFVNRTHRFPKELYDYLSAVAAANGISANALLMQCIEFALSRWGKPLLEEGTQPKKFTPPEEATQDEQTTPPEETT